MSTSTDQLHVVIAGGGVAALETTLALRALAFDRVSIELIAPEPEFVYRPLAVTDPFLVGETRRFPLGRLVHVAGGILRPGSVVSVDPEFRIVGTETGEQHAYDALVLALGAQPREAVPNALTFIGSESGPELKALLEQAVTGRVSRIVFGLPAGAAWPLPLYELALLTKAFLVDHNTTGVEILVVSPEERPLAVFGTQASDAIAELLEVRGIEFRGRVTPLRFENGVLRLAPNKELEADRVVTLPRLEGPGLAGLPHDRDGFIAVDDFCRAAGEPDVYAVGDLTQFPLKQGGIATQQADVAATDIAARVGGTAKPTPFKPVLRGLLLTGMAARFLRTEPGTAQSIVDTEALWWPPAKIVGRYLAPFLASTLGLAEPTPALEAGAVQVEVEVDPSGRPASAIV
jgi:sulfide:quinone oxidoreductase